MSELRSIGFLLCFWVTAIGAGALLDYRRSRRRRMAATAYGLGLLVTADEAGCSGGEPDHYQCGCREHRHASPEGAAFCWEMRKADVKEVLA